MHVLVCSCSERGKVDSGEAHAPGTVAEELVELVELVEIWLTRPHIIANLGVLGMSNHRQPSLGGATLGND